MAKIILKTNNLSKSYQMGKVQIPALKHVNLNVQTDDFLVIAGPSGSGKTTLLNLLGLIDVPDSGDIYFEKENHPPFFQQNRGSD